jgi:hypothetical protein
MCITMYHHHHRYSTLIPQIFNRTLKKIQKNRAALIPQSKEADTLKNEVAERLTDRLLVI